jgi:hypothetical protein
MYLESFAQFSSASFVFLFLYYLIRVNTFKNEETKQKSGYYNNNTIPLSLLHHYSIFHTKQNEAPLVSLCYRARVDLFVLAAKEIKSITTPLNKYSGISRFIVCVQ